jgi:hypothetical protein
MTSPYQNYKLTSHSDRSKIQNASDYANKSPPKTKTNTPPKPPSPKTQTSTNIPLSNKFTHLAEFPPLPSQLPTYAQKLTASSSLKPQSKSHESSSSSQTQTSSSSQISLSRAFPSPHSADSLQINKSPEINLFPIDQQIEHIQNPRQVVSHMFPPGWNFQPEHPHKSQTFYEFILVDTNSILLTHCKCSFDTTGSRTAYSKCLIKQVISHFQWNGHPCNTRSFSKKFTPQEYNYYDYQNAWYNALYSQNDRFQHSWFFYFDKYLNIQNLPAWFLQWWDQFGPEPPILPPARIDSRTPKQIERGYSNDQIHFPFSLPQIYEKFQSPPALCKFPKLLVFYTRYNLSWIMGWDFAFSSSSSKFLIRQIYVRWWEKYIVNTSDYPKMISDCNLLDPQTNTPFLLSPYKSDTPAKSPFKSHKSKKELKKQLQDALSQISDDSDDEEVRVAMAKNPHLFQDSQDPYEF